jgi:hypothetical protein
VALDVLLTTIGYRRPAEMVLDSFFHHPACVGRTSKRPDPLSRTGVATLSTRPSCSFRPRKECSEGERKIRAFARFCRSSVDSRRSRVWLSNGWLTVYEWKHASRQCFVISSIARRWPTIGTGERMAATWLILPVVICLSQRLSHACLSTNLYTVKLRMAH